MKKLAIILFIVLSALSSSRSEALTIWVDPGPGGTEFYGDKIYMPFDNLNGQEMLGQNLSLDFTFLTDHAPVRVFTGNHYFSLVYFTLDGQVRNSDLQYGTAYPLGMTLGPAGSQLTAYHSTFGPTGTDQNGFTYGMLVYPSYAGLIFDHYGVHFDITFPSLPGVRLASAEFAIGTNGGHLWHIPEPATLLLLGLGLMALAGVKRKSPPS